MNQGIALLEKRELLFKQKLNLEKWDVLNETPINNKKDAQRYELQKYHLADRKTHVIQQIQDTEALIQNINRSHQIRIPIDTNFANIAQGAVISGAVLPSNMRIYTNVGELNWIVQGKYAVLKRIQRIQIVD